MMEPKVDQYEITIQQLSVYSGASMKKKTRHTNTGFKSTGFGLLIVGILIDLD